MNYCAVLIKKKPDVLFYFIFLVVELVEELVNFRNILAFSECFFRNIDLTNDREWKVNLLHLYEIIKKSYLITSLLCMLLFITKLVLLICCHGDGLID